MDTPNKAPKDPDRKLSFLTLELYILGKTISPDSMHTRFS